MGQLIIVINAAHDRYRRAGIGFSKGENVFQPDTLSGAQIAAIEADPRLRISERAAGAPDPTKETGGPSDPQGTVDTDGVDSPVTLAAAIGLLDPENEDHFTKSGKPQLDALAGLMGKPVSAAERDAAWQALTEAAK